MSVKSLAKAIIGGLAVFTMTYTVVLWGMGRDIPPRAVADAIEVGADGMKLIQEALALATVIG